MKRWSLKLLKNRPVMLGLIAVACALFFLLPYFPFFLINIGLAENPWATGLPFFGKAESEMVNLRVRMGRKAPVDPRLVFLPVDPQSVKGGFAKQSDLKAFPVLSTMNAAWPWPRSVYGDILQRLGDADARIVIFDFLFPKPGIGDDVLRKAAEKYAEKVVLKANLSDFDSGTGEKMTAIAYPSESIIGKEDPQDPRLAYANFWPDPDGVIRRAVYTITMRQANRHEARPEEKANFSTAGRVVNRIEGRDRFAGQPGVHKLFRYAGPPDNTFPTHPVYEIFLSKFWEREQIFNNGAFFKDKIVMVGPSGNYFKDVLPTPYGLMNGAEIHLQAINAALTNSFLTETNGWQEIGLIVAAALIAWLGIFLLRSPSGRFIAGIFLSGVFLFALQMLYDHFDFQVNATVAPILTLNSINLFGLTYEFILERIEKARVRSTFERYVSRNVVREILDKREDFENLLGGKRKEVTILFSDIRGFTTMTENADSTALVERLNQYLSAMVKCVYKTDGTLDKFIGDAVMAVWGNVVSVGLAKDGENAIESALDMLQELRRLNEIWIANGLTKWEIGIGLNHGEVIVGNMGASEKMEFTVIGDAVNLASRLESLTKEYGLELIIGESLAKLVKDKFHLQSVDLVKVKGKNKPVEVFAVLGRSSEPLTEPLATYHRTFGEAVQLFREQKFTEALEKFRESETAKPGDYLAIKVYPPRCLELAANPPGPDWDGAHTMKNK